MRRHGTEKRLAGATRTEPRVGWVLVLPLWLAISLAACGDGPSVDQPTATTAATETSADATPPATTAEPSDTDGDDEGSGDSAQDGGSQTGTATITIDGETSQFDTLACYYGAAAVEAFGDDDLTFAALGQVETSTGTPTIALSGIDSAFGPNYTVLFMPDGDMSLAWQRVGTDAVTVEGDRITAQGDFRKIVDGELTDETGIGSLEANCG